MVKALNLADCFGQSSSSPINRSAQAIGRLGCLLLTWWPAPLTKPAP